MTPTYAERATYLTGRMQGSKYCVGHHIGNVPIVIFFAPLVNPVDGEVEEILQPWISKPSLVIAVAEHQPSWDSFPGYFSFVVSRRTKCPAASSQVAGQPGALRQN